MNALADVGALLKIGTLYREAVDGLFHGAPECIDAFLTARVPAGQRARLIERVSRVRLVPLVENVGALAHLPELIEAYYDGLCRANLQETLVTDGGEAIVRVFVAMSDTAEQSGKIATDAAYALAMASRQEAERRMGFRVTFLIGAGRAGFRGGFDPEHPGVIDQFTPADGVTMQGIRADTPEKAQQLADRYRSAAARLPPSRLPGHGLPGEDDRALRELMRRSIGAHTATLLRIAPLIAPFSGLVPQTRVRIRTTGSVHYGRSIPEYPEEWGGGRNLPDNRDLRDAWPEGVTLPRAINFNLGCTSLGLPAVVSDLRALDAHAATLLGRHAPGYREILAAELPYFVRESVALIFGRSFAGDIAHFVLAAATLGIDAGVREELVGPTSLFAMLYLRYMSDDADGWDETKEHETRATREEELIRRTGTVDFAGLCRLRPGHRWSHLETLIDHDDLPRLLLSRELTAQEKRQCVDARIERWLRTFRHAAANDLRRQWAALRVLPRPDLKLAAIETMIALEHLRGRRGA